MKEHILDCMNACLHIWINAHRHTPAHTGAHLHTPARTYAHAWREIKIK